MKNIATRKNELRITTADPREMLGKFTAEHVTRGWVEDFIDEDTAEVVPISRTEMIVQRGTHIDQDVLAKIRFHQNAGDINTVEVSNQRRAAYMVSYTGLTPWSVTAQIGKKKHKILLYANSIGMAMEVVKDYIELNFKESFILLNVKDFNDCIIIKDNLKKLQVDTAGADIDTDEPEVEIDKKFYKIEVKVTTDNGEYTSSYITHTQDVGTAMILINNWIAENMERRAKEREADAPTEFSTSIISAVVISCSCTIDRDFSLAYLNTNHQ